MSKKSSSHCSCSGGTCQGCACARAKRPCNHSCHGSGGTNDQCLNISLAPGSMDVLNMSSNQVKLELIKRDLWSLDLTGPQMKARLLRTLAASEKSTGTKKKSTSGDDLDDDEDQDADSNSSSKPIGSETEVDGVVLAKEILSLKGQDLAILNILQTTYPRVAKQYQSKSITSHTPMNEVQKVFRFLSLRIHPDKLQRKFQGATQAFQSLVEAFDHFQSAVVLSTDSRRGPQMAMDLTLTRSNANCFTTPVYCPRCRVEWNTPQDGLEKIAYTIFMSGLKVYHCSTCLLDFGCMTALHRCPHCCSIKSEYDYSPEDFNRQIQCTNKSCGKKFGFMLTVIPDRRMKELRDELKLIQETRMKSSAAKSSRSDRSLKRQSSLEWNEVDHDEEDRPTKKLKGGGESVARPDTTKIARPTSIGPPSKSSSKVKLSEVELAFIHGLSSNCPRCGYFPEGRGIKEEHLRAHLDSCTDRVKIAAYQAKQQELKSKAATKAARKEAEIDMQSKQVWSLLGASKHQSWMLTDGAVKQQLKLKGEEPSESMLANIKKFHSTLTGPGSTTTRLIQPTIQPEPSATPAASALVIHPTTSSTNSIVTRPTTTTSSTTTGTTSSHTAARPTIDSLPTQLHSCTRQQILSILSSHDLLIGDENEIGKEDLIERLEAARDECETIEREEGMQTMAD